MVDRLEEAALMVRVKQPLAEITPDNSAFNWV